MTDCLPVIVCIDVEPDERYTRPGDPRPWTGYLGLDTLLAEWRFRLPGLGAAPAHFTWFLRMDAQVEATYGASAWGARTYRRQLESALAHGDEVGLHLHAFRWSASVGWVVEYGDPGWVARCLRESLATFRGAFGRDCAAFRFGEHWLDDAALRVLEDHGIRYDLTLEPGMPGRWPVRRPSRATGVAPDLAAMPEGPYRPSRSDFRRPDPARTDGLWIIPVTTGRLPASVARLRALYRAVTHPRWRHIETLTLNPGLSPVFFRPLLRRVLAQPERRLLVLPVRSDAGRTRRRRGHVRRNLAQLLADGGPRRLAVCTPGEALAALGLEPAGAGPRAGLAGERRGVRRASATRGDPPSPAPDPWPLARRSTPA